MVMALRAWTLILMHHTNLSGNERKMNVSTTKTKCMGMWGNNTQRAELRVENKIIEKI